MRLKLYRATSVAEAMALVRAELGTEALILSTRRIAGGVELTAALEQEGEPENSIPLPPAHVPSRQPEPPPRRGSPSFAFHGLPPPLAARLAGADLALALRATFRFGLLPITQAGPPLMLAGLPGAGKTLTIARLATRLVLAGIAPMVITADGKRAGAAEELAAYTRLLGIGLVVASTPKALQRALGRRLAETPVLIDTAGVNPFAADALAELACLVEAAGAAPVLVMPAGLDCAEAIDQGHAFAPLGTQHLLPTRLDLARRLGSVLGTASSADLILTEAGTGSGASDGLTPLTPEFLAERLSQGPPAVAAFRPPVFPPARARIAENARQNGYGDDDFRR